VSAPPPQSPQPRGANPGSAKPGSAKQGSAKPGGAQPGRSPRPTTPPWSLAHLPPALAVTAVLALVAAPVAGLLGDGWGSALAAVAGFALVALAFSASSVVVAAAGSISDALTLPAALAIYLLKVVILGVVLVSVRDSESVDTRALAWSVAVGTVGWVTTQCVRFARTPLFYVDPR
jgi:ATP synthase protein I